MTRTIHCLTHQCTAESYISRCYWALWANALEKCEIREMEIRELPQIDGQESLGVADDGAGMFA